MLKKYIPVLSAFGIREHDYGNRWGWYSYYDGQIGDLITVGYEKTPSGSKDAVACWIRRQFLVPVLNNPDRYNFNRTQYYSEEEVTDLLAYSPSSRIALLNARANPAGVWARERSMA